MVKNTATVIVDNATAQELVGWVNGKLDITKTSDKIENYVTKWFKTGTVTVDDGVITHFHNLISKPPFKLML